MGFSSWGRYGCSWASCLKFFFHVPCWVQGAFLSAAFTNHILMSTPRQPWLRSSPTLKSQLAVGTQILSHQHPSKHRGSVQPRSQFFNPEGWEQGPYCQAFTWAFTLYFVPASGLGLMCWFFWGTVCARSSCTHFVQVPSDCFLKKASTATHQLKKILLRSFWFLKRKPKKSPKLFEQSWGVQECSKSWDKTCQIIYESFVRSFAWSIVHGKSSLIDSGRSSLADLRRYE